MCQSLALEPAILLIEKPCGALDPSALAVVEELIQHNCYTVVIEAHNLAQMRRVANYAVFFGWQTVLENSS